MRSKTKPEWFEDEGFWRQFYLFMFSEKRFAEAAEQVPRLLALAKPQDKAVLDLCCGPGRFCIPLAKLGFRVTGVDKARYLLAKARARAKSARVAVEWVQEDMRAFVRPGAFDLALSLLTSFGYFEDKKEDTLVLENIYRSLRPGGCLLMDLMGKEVLARIAQPATCETMADGSKLVQCAQLSDGWTRIKHEWVWIRQAKARTYHFQTTIYSGEELRALLSQAGFGDVRLYGSLDGSDYDLNAKRLIALATKPPARPK